MFEDHIRQKKHLIVFGLLSHEQKMSLLNVVLKRTPDPDSEPIASKDKLIFQCGFRRFITAPIFSEHTYTPKHKVRFIINYEIPYKFYLFIINNNCNYFISVFEILPTRRDSCCEHVRSNRVSTMSSFMLPAKE